MQRQGLYGWFNKNLRGRKGQQGFTLIELLVVVTILGILAAIVTLSLIGVTTNASEQSCNTEYKTVQTALDTYLSTNDLAVLPSGAQGTFTNDMTGTHGGNVALWNANPSATQPGYTTNQVTQFYYEWNQFGRITSIASNAAGNPVTNCVPH